MGDSKSVPAGAAKVDVAPAKHPTLKFIIRNSVKLRLTVRTLRFRHRIQRQFELDHFGAYLI